MPFKVWTPVPYDLTRLELLGANLRLDQIHSVARESGVLKDRPVLDELASKRASGVSIGLKVTVPWQGQTIERAVEVGDFETVHATWNLLEQGAGAARRAPGMRARV